VRVLPILALFKVYYGDIYMKVTAIGFIPLVYVIQSIKTRSVMDSVSKSKDATKSKSDIWRSGK